MTAFKAILFEFKDRQLYNSLPDLVTLQAIDPASLRVLRSLRNEAVQLAELEKNAGPPTTMSVVKLTERNYQDFETSFRSLVSRTKGCRGIILDYLLHDTNGVYNALWTSRRYKLPAPIVVVLDIQEIGNLYIACTSDTLVQQELVQI